MGSSGSGGGSTANVFSPPGQGAVAGQLGDIIGPLAGMSMNGGAGTPGAWAYPQAQSLYPGGYNAVSQFLTGSLGGGAPTAFDTLSGNALGGASAAGNFFNSMYPQFAGEIPGLAAGAGSGLNYLDPLMQNAFNPMYGQAVNQTANNPYFNQAMQGAQQGATYGQGGAGQMYNAGSGIMQSAFDPQSALRNQQQQRITDTSAAANAMSGLGSSPYGASTTANALGNFGINWENQQLGRQTAGAQAADPQFTGASALSSGSAALPSSTYMSQIGNVLNALKSQNQAGALGASAFPSLLGGVSSGLGQADALSSNIGNQMAGFAGLPYQTGAGIAGNALTGLGNLQNQLTGATQIGNNQFVLPQQVMQDMMQYMGLGQSASGISGQLGQMGFDQTARGLGGALSGANTLFGNNGMLSGGGGLFGGGSGLSSGLTGAAAMPGFDTLGSTVGMGAADVGGGGGLMSALPALALS
jgi:hypothetical protein